MPSLNPLTQPILRACKSQPGPSLIITLRTLPCHPPVLDENFALVRSCVACLIRYPINRFVSFHESLSTTYARSRTLAVAPRLFPSRFVCNFGHGITMTRDRTWYLYRHAFAATAETTAKIYLPSSMTGSGFAKRYKAKEKALTEPSYLSPTEPVLQLYAILQADMTLHLTTPASSNALHRGV